MPGKWDWVRIQWAICIAAAGLLGAAWIFSAAQGEEQTSTETQPTRIDRADLARFGAHAADVVFIVAAAPGRLELTAVPSDSADLSPDTVRATVDSQPLDRLGDCGWNCVAADAPVLEGKPSVVGVEVRRKGRRAARTAVPLPAALPPAGTSLFRSVKKRMATIRTVRIDEVLSNGQTSVRTRFLFRAPDRMRYEIVDGSKAVVIGPRRWDWQGRRWEASTTEPLRSPAWIWEGAAEPRMLGSARLEGRPVRVLSLFRSDPRFPALFRLLVDGQDRVLRAQMLSVGHFMVDKLSAFNRPVVIKPPV